jgi:hypothetical protein
MNGVDAIGAIRTEWPWAKIIVLSTFGGMQWLSEP